MTKQSLTEMIQKIVEEEVKKSLPTLVPQIIAEIFLSKTTQPISERKVVNQPAIVPQPTTPVKKEMKRYTSNEALNKVLNETTVSIPQEGSMVQASLGSHTSILDHAADMPAPVANALKKDYSSLMKAIDSKRKSGNLGSSNTVGMM